MPKKTKKEKLIAQYRRKLTSLVTEAPIPQNVPSNPKPVEPPHTTYTYQKPSSQSPKIKSISLAMDDFTAIKKDLVWTLFLCSFIIIGEIVLWRVVG